MYQRYFEYFSKVKTFEAAVFLYSSLQTILCVGVSVLKNLGCPYGNSIYIEKEVGRQLGCGAGNPPRTNKFFKKT
jgi:hypothetical protein